MDLTSWLFVPGVVGGLVVAILLRVFSTHRSAKMQPDVFAHRTSVSGTDVINVSAIRIAGLGGLGLVAMSFVLAWTFPRIGQTLTLGVVSGVGVAAFLVWQRRREGPLSKSSGRPGANTTLSIEQPSSVVAPDAAGSATRDSKTIRFVEGSV